MLYQLEEERKVTENLSKGLELEKRKVESLEQRAKHSGSSRGSRESESGRRRSSLVPDCVKDAEDRLVQSMEIYRQRCDNLGTSLHSLRDQTTVGLTGVRAGSALAAGGAVRLGVVEETAKTPAGQEESQAVREVTSQTWRSRPQPQINQSPASVQTQPSSGKTEEPEAETRLLP